MQYLNKIVFRTPLFSITKEITQPYFNEALYLASSNLYDETQKQSIKNANKVNVSLYKYQTRSQNRCTPFGLFAGLSIGNWQNENNIILNADLKKALSRKTRLDMNVLYSLAQKLTKLDFIKPFLKYYPNTSIYQIGKHYRYVEYYYENNIRFHKINKIDYSEYIVGILCACKQGLTQQNISNLLVDEDISIEEANAFVEELILSQVLINQFEPKITGNDYFGVMLEELKKINSLRQNIELQKLISVLVYIEKLIQQLDENIFNEIESYKHIYETLKQVLPDISETNLFQTDLYKQYDNAILNHEIQTQIKNTISFLDKITLPNSSKNIETFIQNFYGRYEDDEVALSTVLDTESGIGYPSKDSNGINDLLNGFYFSNLESETNIKWNLLQNCLFKLLNDGLKENKKVIKISEENFKEVDFSKSILPLSFCVMFNVINAQTNKINIKSIGGSSAVNLLGRFACGDKEIEEIVMQITDFEQKQEPEKIFAEIVHLPESRTGNILFRPCIRKFEIPYLAKSSVEESFQIKMTDLFIRVRNNKIILFDKRLNKEIIPRLGNAHNFHFNSLPVYHFLCDLQTQYFEKSYLGFNWGVLSDQYSYLPRVEFQNVILSPAKWQLNKVDIEYLQVKKKGEENVVIYQRFFELKNRIELPDKFLVIEGDNELLIDTSVPIAIDTFIDIVKNKNQITLEEYLFDDNEALVKDSEGNSFTNECIAIVLNENKLQPVANNATKEKQSKKIFSIGSEWLYYKIYCGVKTADDIITQKLKPLTEKLLHEKIIDKWFFIRYADPDNHLRFRIHIVDLKKYSDVIAYIHDALNTLLDQYIIFKLQTDTYKRELERYGDNSIELAEELFFHDSFFITEMLSMLDIENGGVIRWQIALRSVDEFLNDFEFTLEEKHKWVERLSLAFFNEHGGGKNLKVTLDNKYRKLRSEITKVLNKLNDEEQEYYPIVKLLSERSYKMKPIIETILKLNKDGLLQVNLTDLLSSYVHMSMNRLFMGRNRTNEFVVYDLLSKQYKSILAQQKHATKSINA